MKDENVPHSPSLSTEKSHDISPQKLLEESIKMINESIKDCQMEGFQPVELGIPQAISATELQKQITSPGGEELFSMANTLFASQEELFNPQIAPQQNEANNSSSAGNDSLNNVDELFNSQ